MTPLLLTTSEAATLVGRSPSTIRWWAHRGHITPAGRHPETGATLYPADQVTRREHEARLILQTTAHRGTNTPVPDVCPQPGQRAGLPHLNGRRP